mmetsp:Transcript_25464/g.61342  ORF Transcript_25464/g.61342 Transcript_25464/m.61342 type:complete len:108 (-) Transcript_25464:197-520(-)
MPPKSVSMQDRLVVLGFEIFIFEWDSEGVDCWRHTMMMEKMQRFWRAKFARSMREIHLISFPIQAFRFTQRLVESSPSRRSSFILLLLNYKCCFLSLQITYMSFDST